MKSGFRYGLYALAFFTALGLSAYLTMWFIVRGQPEVLVPDLIGQDAVGALKTLSDLGLNLKVRGFEYSGQAPENHVIAQDPPAGTRVKPKREIKVVLSKGGATVSLPDVRGLPLEQARSMLEHSRLTLGLVSYTYGFGPEQGRDHVLAQVPDPMVSVSTGAKVDLLLSLGPRPVYLVMPDLTGQPYSLALEDLEQAGLELGSLKTEVRPGWPAEAVVTQEPAPGRRVAKGSLVTLTINRGRGPEPARYRFHLLEYFVPYGLFRCEIKFRVAVGSFLFDLHEEWSEPGQRIRVLALTQGPLQAQVFEDGEEKALLKAD